MTRENKLALVLGFGLLLLAGILVSDYLSAGNRVQEDPLIAATPSQIPNSEILKPATPLILKSPSQRRQTAQDPTPKPLKELTLGKTPRVTEESRRRRDVPEVDVYMVKEGDALSTISKTYYGSSEFTDEIARFNNLGDPNRVKVGTRLVLPKSLAALKAPSDTQLRRQGSPAQEPTRIVAQGNRTVTVREGETLSDIAKRELGNGNKWHALWTMNKNVIPDPDRLRAGIVLQLPTT